MVESRFSLRERYEEFKRRGFLIQVLRLVNMMFASFTFWNLVIQPDPLRGLYDVEIAVLYVALPLGSVLGFLLLVLFRDSIHLALLPLVAIGFILSSTTDYTNSLIAIPVWSACLLLLSRFILRSAAFFSVSKSHS